jgi:hypothetical protein
VVTLYNLPLPRKQTSRSSLYTSNKQSCLRQSLSCGPRSQAIAVRAVRVPPGSRWVYLHRLHSVPSLATATLPLKSPSSVSLPKEVRQNCRSQRPWAASVTSTKRGAPTSNHTSNHSVSLPNHRDHDPTVFTIVFPVRHHRQHTRSFRWILADPDRRLGRLIRVRRSAQSIPKQVSEALEWNAKEVWAACPWTLISCVSRKAGHWTSKIWMTTGGPRPVSRRRSKSWARWEKALAVPSRGASCKTRALYSP